MEPGLPEHGGRSAWLRWVSAGVGCPLVTAPARSRPGLMAREWHVGSWREQRTLRVLIYPVAVDPHASGAGFWPPVQLERPTGRTGWTGGQVPARLRPGRRWRDGSAEQPPTRSGLLMDLPAIPEPEPSAGGAHGFRRTGRLARP